MEFTYKIWNVSITKALISKKKMQATCNTGWPLDFVKEANTKGAV